MDYIFEGCCTCTEDVSGTRAMGAARVELCTNLDVGGTTPSSELIKDALEILDGSDTLLNILVRPRGGNFVFSEEEIGIMEKDILTIKHIRAGSVGVNGFVLGALRPDGSIDIETMKRLIAAARPLQVTFNRAFDECDDVSKGLEDIISLGCERLLTSGHHADAFTGRFALRELVRQAGGRTIILAGCGVRPHNIDEIASVSGVKEFHSSVLQGWK